MLIAFNKLFLRDFGPYGLDGITQLLQVCRLRIYDVAIGALLDCGLVTVEAPGDQSIHCHGSETSLSWSELSALF